MHGLILGLALGFAIFIGCSLLCLWASICDKLFDGIIGFLIYFGTSIMLFCGVIGYLSSK